MVVSEVTGERVGRQCGRTMHCLLSEGEDGDGWKRETNARAMNLL